MGKFTAGAKFLTKVKNYPNTLKRKALLTGGLVTFGAAATAGIVAGKGKGRKKK